MERVLPNGIIIYGEQNDHDFIKRLLAKYSTLLQNMGIIVDIPENEWMQIQLKKKLKPPTRIYF